MCEEKSRLLEEYGLIHCTKAQLEALVLRSHIPTVAMGALVLYGLSWYVSVRIYQKR